MTVRMADLADRLEGVRVGGIPQPLESWMEDLYRRVSDKREPWEAWSESCELPWGVEAL
jgi:hypothetical protein